MRRELSWLSVLLWALSVSAAEVTLTGTWTPAPGDAQLITWVVSRQQGREVCRVPWGQPCLDRAVPEGETCWTGVVQAGTLQSAPSAPFCLTVAAAPPPTALMAVCAGDGLHTTLTWPATKQATTYLVRVDDLGNNTPTCQDGWYCGGVDYLGPGQTSTTYTAASKPGVPLRAWVHAVVGGVIQVPLGVTWACPLPGVLPKGYSDVTVSFE